MCLLISFSLFEHMITRQIKMQFSLNSGCIYKILAVPPEEKKKNMDEK